VGIQDAGHQQLFTRGEIMRRSLSRAWRIVSLAAVVAIPTPLAAQFIALKTVPVAAGDQFLLFPSRNLGMGSVSIAVDDSILDPFVNPAKGARIAESQVFAAPTYYNVSNDAGSAGTLSLGALFSGAKVYGSGMVALQQLNRGNQFGPVFFAERDVLPPDALESKSATNKYGFLSIGTLLPGEVALGGSMFLAELNGIDGVEHLYAMSSAIEQSGNMKDFRIGATKTFAGQRTAEALLLYHRFDMRHDVTYVDWVLVDSTTWEWDQVIRTENNVDKTDTWGIHLGYVQPVGSTGWRLGGIFTANRKSHPKIPNYEIMNIPRDPGNSTAFDVGVGIAKVAGPTTFAIDIVYEPGNSNTWAEAEEDVPTADSGVIRKGEKTVENEFSFSNAFVNVGVNRVVGPVAFQLGLGIRAYDYHLDQWDHVEDEFRRQDEQWMEWVPSWGLRLRLGDLELRYIGRVTTGTGRPGVAWNGAVAERAADFSSANDILLAPSAPLTLQDVTVLTHQVSVSVPIR
jgi:hypothetical protein